jgi:hypothetical protein
MNIILKSKTRTLIKLLSSYNFNFSGLKTINRQEGIGSEFVLVKKATDLSAAQSFILDPEQYYSNKSNPNIHTARYLSVSAIAEPAKTNSSISEILSPQSDFKVELFNPYQFKKAKIESQSYTLTANYSVPYGLWLAENKLGQSGYWTLLNKEEHLRMPHVFMLEPINPIKRLLSWFTV